MSTYDLTHDTDEQRRGTHPVIIGHLVMGLAFLGITAIWAVSELGNVSVDDVRWLLPLPWVFAGTVGLLAVVLTSRRRSTQRATTAYGAEDAPVFRSDHDDPTTVDHETPEEER